MKTLVAAAALLLSGCTATLTVRYEPTTIPRPLVGAENAPLYIEQVEDLGGGVRSVAHKMKIKTTRPLEEIVREALVTELTRLGFPLRRSPAEAKAVLLASVSNTTLVWPESGLFRAGTRVLLRLRTPDQRPLWEGELKSNSEIESILGGGFAGDKPRRVLQMALDQALEQLGPLLERQAIPQLIASGAASAPAVAAPASPRPTAARARSDVDELPEPRAIRPRTHAVAIGIERYREQLPPADFAADDARLFAEYAKRVLGVPDDSLALLLDEKATRGDLVKTLERWLPNRVQPGDEVYVYYSGHGAPSPKGSGSYLVPHEGDPAYLEETAYPVKRLYAELAKLPAARVTVMLDACFTGTGGRSVIAAGARPLVSAQAVSVPRNLLVLSASSESQISNSYKEKGHGLFTYFLLKGLKEKGPELLPVFEYLKPEVAAVARRLHNADQEPQWLEGK